MTGRGEIQSALHTAYVSVRQYEIEGASTPPSKSYRIEAARYLGNNVPTASKVEVRTQLFHTSRLISCQT